MFKGLGAITSYAFQFNGATGIITGSDGYSFDCNQKIPQILSNLTYNANDLVYSMSNDWLLKHAPHCFNSAENKWDWECIRQAVAPNVLSDAYIPLYPAIDAWIVSKRGSVPGSTGTPTGGSSGGSTTGTGNPTGGSGSGSGSGTGTGLPSGSTDGSNFCVMDFCLPKMAVYIGAGILALMMLKR